MFIVYINRGRVNYRPGPGKAILISDGPILKLSYRQSTRRGGNFNFLTHHSYVVKCVYGTIVVRPSVRH